MDFLNRFSETIQNFENSDVPFIYFVLTFFFAVTLRNFLEMFATGIPASPLFFWHFDTSYVFLALCLIVVFYLGTREKVEKIARVILPCFIILVIVPVIDLAVSGGKGLRLAYMTPEDTPSLLEKFFTFFGPNFRQGITLGIRVEVLLVIMGSFFYFYLKKGNLPGALFFSFLIYSVIFFYLSIPFTFKGFMELMGQEYQYSGILFGKFYLVMIFSLLMWIFAFPARNAFSKLEKRN